VHVVRQRHPSIDVKRMTRPSGPNGAAKCADLGDQHIGAAITQIDGKEMAII